MGERIRHGEGTVSSSGRNGEHGAAGGCRRILGEQWSSQERADPGDNGRVESRGPHSPRSPAGAGNRGAKHGAMRRGQAIARCRSHSPAMRSISGSLSWRNVSLPFLVMSQSKCSRRKPGGKSRRAAGRDGAGVAQCAALPGAWLLVAPAGTVGNVARGSRSFGCPTDLPAPGMTVAQGYRPAGFARRPPSGRGPGCVHSTRPFLRRDGFAHPHGFLKRPPRLRRGPSP